MRGLPAGTICNLKVFVPLTFVANGFLFERVILSVSHLKGRQGYVTCKRLGWDTFLCCVCVSAIATDTPLHCFLDFECVLFVLSVLRVGRRIVFFDVTNVKREWN